MDQDQILPEILSQLEEAQKELNRLRSLQHLNDNQKA